MSDLDLAELRRLVESLRPRFPLRQGELLLTRDVQRWPEERRQKFREIEERLVFIGFTGADEGRSRMQIARCQDADWAALIVAVVNALPELLSRAERLDRAEKALREIKHEYETAGNHGAVEAVERRLQRKDAALKPFADIGMWLFARDLPDNTPMVHVEGLGHKAALTRGHFKAAHLARALTPEPDHAD